METQGPTSGPVARSVENASAVVRAMLPGPAGLPPHRAASDVTLAGILLLVVTALVEAILSGGSFSYLEFRHVTGALAMHVAALLIVMLLAGRAEVLAGLAVGVFWALTMGQGLAVIGALITETDSLAGWLVGYALPAYLPLLLYILSASGPIAGAVGAAAFLLSVVVMAADRFVVEEPLVPILPDTEAVYLKQAALLEAQLSELRPSRVGVPETFALVGGGHPDEAVFAREVTAVAALLEERYGARDRVIRLLNSTKAPTGLPLLNRSNFSAALTALAANMGPEDVAIIFLTSHGAPGALATQFAGVSTRDLSASDVARGLHDSGIGNSVVIVSACYAGSFLDALATRERLVLTAASDDRTSFGCSDEAEWTNWGRAFWVDALNVTRDPREAAEIAADLVRIREAEMGYPPSQPQIVEGNAIGPVLDRWLAALPEVD